MKKRTMTILTILAISMIIATAITGYQFYADDSGGADGESWGAGGELSLKMDRDTINMTLNDTPTMRYTLANIGNTDLRVFWAYPCIKPQLYYFTNNSTVRWVGPNAAPPPASYFNNDRLIVINAHDSIVEDAKISKDLWEYHK